MKKPRTVFWGLYPLCLILGLGVLLAAGWHASSALQALYREQKRDSLEQQALLLEEAVAAALSAPDSEAVDRLCKAVGRRAATRVTVVLPGGKVAGDSAEDPGRMDYHNKRPEILEAMAGRVGTSIRHSRTAKREMMYVAVPLKSPNMDSPAGSGFPSCAISFGSRQRQPPRHPMPRPPRPGPPCQSG